jgi:hypothetical protein
MKYILPEEVAHCFSIESRSIFHGYTEILSGQDAPSERRVTVEANAELLQEGEQSSSTSVRTQRSAWLVSSGCPDGLFRWRGEDLLTGSGFAYRGLQISFQ